MNSFVRSAALLLCFQSLILSIDAQATIDTKNFLRETRFQSVEAFLAAAADFNPSQSNDFLAWEFATAEVGQPEDNKTGQMLRPSKIQSALKLCDNAAFALVFVVANPPTKGTNSCVGVIFLLQHVEKIWRIADLKKFTAYGKYSSVDAKITSDEATPVITITEDNYGQHAGFSVSASYEVSGNVSLTQVRLR